MNDIAPDRTCAAAAMPEHLHASYNDIHLLIRDSSAQIAAEFQPNLLIAIGNNSAPAIEYH